MLKKENQELKEKYLNAVADYEKTRFEKEQLNSLVNSCQEEIRQLKKQLDKYENPEDMTLFAMWCTEKVKDENKQLKNNWDELKEWLEEKWEVSQDIWFVKIINKMKGLENGDSND